MRARYLMVALLLGASWMATARDVGFEPHPGARLPLETQLLDESGRPVALGATMGGVPWILVLGYFSCPNLCDTVRADLINALRSVPANRSYAVAAVSVDVREGEPELLKAKARDADYATRGGAWHYLRADERTLAALSDATGFKDRYDSASGQIAHPAGVVFVTPAGQISSYLLGVGYRGEEVKAALEEASQGRTAHAPPAAIALLCFDYDAATGRYSFAIIKLLRVVAVLSVLAIAAGLYALFRGPRPTP